MTDKFYKIGGLVLLTLACASAAATSESQSTDLSRFLHTAVAQDAPTTAARLRWEAARERVPSASALPDPELAYGYFISPVETRVGAQQQKFGLYQKMPWPARLREKGKLAEAQVGVVYYDYLATLRERMAAAKLAWLQRASTQAQERILDRELELLDEALATLDSGLVAGRSDLADRSLLRQQVTQVESRRLSLIGDIEASLASIRRFAGAAAETFEPDLKRIHSRALPARAELRRVLLENSERLQASSAAVGAAERAREVARLERRPDITLGFEYTEINDNIFSNPTDNGEDAIMGSIRISLPIWKGKYDAIEASARRELSAARAQEHAMTDELTLRMREAYARAEAIERQLRLYDTKLLPQTRETYDATVAAFRSGRGDALRWIEAQQDRLDAEMGRILLHTQYLRAIIALERICAVSLIEESEPQDVSPTK